MHTKLAGRLPLQEMITRHIDAARTKIASADEKTKKLVEHEKKEHGKIPSKKEEEAEHEKKSSVIDFHDAESVEKLAAALEAGADLLVKEADSIENGGEKKQGGEQLATQSPTPGKQSYITGKATAKHQIPTSTGLQATKDNPGAATAVPTDDARAPGGTGAKYPAKGVLKTAAESVLEKLKEKRDSDKAKKEEPKKDEKKDEEKEKKSSAVEYVLGKIAKVENGGESRQGGEQLDNTAPVPSNPGRQLISSNAAPVSATKREAKAPQKKLLKEVLTEPALSASTDQVVNQNLRNASKGGVKIAAVKACLQKIAEGGCQCDGKGECKHCKLKSAVEAKKSEKKAS
jgi:hypothetical protein